MRQGYSLLPAAQVGKQARRGVSSLHHPGSQCQQDSGSEKGSDGGGYRLASHKGHTDLICLFKLCSQASQGLCQAQASCPQEPAGSEL